MRLGIALLAAALCSCSGEPTSEGFVVGIGGEYQGRASCEDTEHTALISCEIRRIDGSREPVIRGLYRVASGSTPSAALTIGLPSYTPELRLVPTSRDATTTDVAATLCSILSNFGGADVECRVASDPTAVSGRINIELSGESCPLIAGISDGGQASVILQGCASWDAAYQNLLQNFGALETWYVDQVTSQP